jgi:hypothetical protein
VGFLRIALAVHDERNVVHVKRLARISLLHDGREIAPDLGPNVKERTAERFGVLPPEDLGVGVIVDQSACRSPDHEHRLVRAQHNGDQRTQRHGPALGKPKR